MFKPQTRMISSQTSKTIQSTKSIQTKEIEKRKNVKSMNKFVQTLYDANKIEQLKKEIEKLRLANEAEL